MKKTALNILIPTNLKKDLMKYSEKEYKTVTVKVIELIAAYVFKKENE